METIDMIKVELTEAEIDMAGYVGFKRAMASLSAKGEGNFNVSRNFHPHIAGAIGEYAVCKYYKLFWDASIGVFDQKNDLPGFEYPVDVKTNSRQLQYATEANISTREDMTVYEGFLFMFVAYYGTTVYIQGYIPSDEYLSIATIKKGVGYMPDYYSVPVSKLKPL